MSRKDQKTYAVPTLVAERLLTWGRSVRAQRVAQKIRSSDLCVRLAISHPTLSRLERGDASVTVGTYLSALHILGILPHAAPALSADLWQLKDADARARPSTKDDDEYF